MISVMISILYCSLLSDWNTLAFRQSVLTHTTDKMGGGYVRYVPSSIETAWTTGDVTGKICSLLSDQTFLLKRSLRGDPDQLSFFEDETGTRSYIEPITGIARHPFAPVGCKTVLRRPRSLFNISHILVDSDCKTDCSPSVLFDMGCSVYHNTRSASAVGPSIPLFLKMYKKSHPVRRIFAWEAKTVSEWWKHVPPRVKYMTHYYNTPVTASEFEISLSSVKEEDFVVVKLDIDNTEVELGIVDVIKKNARLIDEFFFEYHFYFDGLDFGWGDLSRLKSTHNVTTAVRLMTDLRRLGIRSHFWI